MALRYDLSECSGPSEPARFAQTFHLLLAAHGYSQTTGSSSWDFAIEIQLLYDNGLTVNDLRWLVCRGYVDHAHDVTRLQDQHRRFRPSAKLKFSTRTCFILTEQGVNCASCLLEFSEQQAPVAKEDPLVASVDQEASSSGSHSHPVWNPDRRELRVRGRLVKCFKWPALNQEMILASFEEDAWPARIDDPLPPQPEQDPKRRLSDTIKCLNRKQKNQLLHFRGDGTGEGVIWEFFESNSPTQQT